MMKYTFRKITALLMMLCLAATMTGLPATVYGSGLDDAAIVAVDKEVLAIGFAEGDSAAGVTGYLTLPLTGLSGSAITWDSGNMGMITDDGIVIRPITDKEVTLTATITYGEAEDTQEFTVTVLGGQADTPEQSDDGDEETEHKPADDDREGSESQEDILPERGTRSPDSPAGLAGSRFGSFSMDGIEGQSDLTLVTIADKFIDNEGFYPDGLDGVNLVGYQKYESVDYGDMTALLKFDLQSIETNKAIEKAKLQLYIVTINSINSQADIYADIYGSNDHTWEEGEGTYIPAQKEFLLRQPLDSASDQYKWKSFDVTSFIQAAGNDIVTFVLTGPPAPSNSGEFENCENLFSFYDRSYQDAAMATRLQVTYDRYVNLSNNTVKEGYPAGTLVGTLEAHPDLTGPCAFSILNGDTDSFEISGDQLLTKRVLDYSEQNAYDLVIRVTDADGNTFNETFTIQVIEAQAPTGSLTINDGSSSTDDTRVALSITASDPEGTSLQMRFSNDGAQWSAWEAYAPAKAWTLADGGGPKTVYMELKNALGKTTSFNAAIFLDTTGDGSAQNPYRVSTPEQLDAVRNHLDCHYIQTADIDLSDYGNWTPIGNFENPFTGSYKGNGFTISGLGINTSALQYVGLFGGVGNYSGMARLEGIHLEDVQVQSSEQNGSTGGLVGYLDRGEVVDCSSSGSVTGSWRTGGLIGTVSGGGIVNRSGSSGSVAGIRDQMAIAGGLIGSNSGTVSQCSSDSDVTVGSNGFGGGFVGECASSSGSTAAISNSRSGGTVRGESAFTIGGFAGSLNSNIGQGVRMENCYSSGGINAQSGIKGGLVGRKNTGNETVANCYFDSDRAGSVSADAGGTPLATEQMKIPGNYSGWDFTNTWKTTGNSYPILSWEGVNALILLDKNALTWDRIKGVNEAEDNVTVDLTNPLPTSGGNGTSISWSASPGGWINTSTGKVTRPTFSQGDKTIILTATVSITGGTSQKKQFVLTVRKEGIKELTVINATARSKVYDGSTAAVIEGAELSGVTPGDDVALADHEAGIFTQKGVGIGIALTTNMSLAGSHAAGYVLVQPTLTADITPRTLNVGFTGVNRAYNGTAAAAVTTTDDRVAGDVFEITRTAAFADQDIGVNKPVSVTGVSLTGPDAGNYSVAATGSTTANITARPLTVTADAKSKAYGETDPAFTYQIVPGSLVDGDTLSGGLTRAPGEGVGNYEIQQGTLTAGNNYNLTYVPGNLTIGKRGLTVTADAKSKAYGEADPAFTYQITSGSLVGGDTLSGELTRAPGEEVSDYEIQQGTLTAGDNYNLTYVPGNLIIGKRGLTVTADAKSKAYGGADPVLTYQITSGSLVGSDTLSGELTRAPGEDTDDYEIQRGTLTAGDNYDLTYVPANLTIGKRPLTVTADVKGKTYGETDPAFTYQATSGSLVGGDTLSGELTRAPGEGVGVYEIRQGTLTAGDNYDLIYVSRNLTIGKRALTVTADARSKAYGETDPAFTYQITSGSLVGGDTLSGELTRAPGEEVSDYEIQQGTLTAGDNYELTYVPAYLTISYATYILTITADTGGRITSGPNGSYAEGTVINIAAVPDTNYRFSGWTSTSGGTFGNTNDEATAFVMPASATTITANFSYTGSSSGSSSGSGVTPTPTPAPAPTVDARGNISASPRLDQSTGMGTADIDASMLNTALARAAVNSDGQKRIEIVLPEVQGAAGYVSTLPASSLSSGTNTQLAIKAHIANVTLPGNMLAQTDAQTVSLTIAQGDVSGIDAETRNRIGDRPVIQLGLLVGGEPYTWSNENAPVTVSIPYTPTAAELADPEHITVWYIDGAGNVVEVPPGRYDPATGRVNFSVTHFSRYAVVYVRKTFSDLKAVEWARKAVEVLASKEILRGTSGETYDPQADITRADFLYSLVRTLGVDARVNGNFDDISSDAYYYKEIGIARALGITSGTGNNRFAPDAGISRQDMMVLTERALRMLGRLDVQGSAAELERFSDKPQVAGYAINGVASVVQAGLIVGSGDRINPLGHTTRAEAAVFLHRIYNK